MRARDISPGTVLYLRQQPLQKHKDCKFTNKFPDENKTRPHLCLDVSDFYSLWTTFTSRDRPQRLHIATHWREGGFKRWRFDDEIYLWDGAFLVCGPTQVFVDAAQGVELLDKENLARLDSDGLYAVRKEVMRQKVRRPHWFTEHCADLGIVLRWHREDYGRQA